MRYPRFFILLFVALGLAGLPTVDAYGTEADPLPGALRQIESAPDGSQHPWTEKDLVHREAIVEALARGLDLDHRAAGRLFDAVAGLVVIVGGAGERAGVLEIPESDELLVMVSELVGSIDAQPDRASAGEDFLVEQTIAAMDLLTESERVSVDALTSMEAIPVAGPIERWRPLVERYFSPERIEEALSIIDCESNGDSDALNPRSGAAGLFQFIDRTWSHSSEKAGFEGESPFSPEANVAAAAWLVEYSLDVGDAPWAHWTCRP